MIREVSAVTRREQLREILTDYRLDRRNRAFLRSRLRLRVSTRKLERLGYALIKGAQPGDSIPAGDSASPIPMDQDAKPATGQTAREST